MSCSNVDLMIPIINTVSAGFKRLAEDISKSGHRCDLLNDQITSLVLSDSTPLVIPLSWDKCHIPEEIINTPWSLFHVKAVTL